jgi:hypothetical protein
MKRIRIVGLCLVAVFAMSAIASASASAEELSYKTCIKAVPKESGKFNDKACTVASKGGKKEGDYELGAWNAGKKTTFTGKNGVSTLDSYIPENEATPWTGGTVVGAVTCKSGKSAGSITGPKTGSVKVEFKTCTSEGKKCTSAGAKAGTIDTKPLTTTLAWAASETPTVVQDVEATGGGASAEFNCEGLAVVTVGDVLGVASKDVNTISKEGTQTFAVNAKGGQDVPFYWNTFGEAEPHISILVSLITPPGIELPSGENTVSTLKGEAMEIAATP